MRYDLSVRFAMMSWRITSSTTVSWNAEPRTNDLAHWPHAMKTRCHPQNRKCWTSPLLCVLPVAMARPHPSEGRVMACTRNTHKNRWRLAV